LVLGTAAPTASELGAFKLDRAEADAACITIGFRTLVQVNHECAVSQLRTVDMTSTLCTIVLPFSRFQPHQIWLVSRKRLQYGHAHDGRIPLAQSGID